MNETNDRRSRDVKSAQSLAYALETLLDARLSPRGRSLYRLHRTVPVGIAFGVLWTGVMLLFAALLRTSGAWTIALIAPPLWYAWHSLRRPYAELMLCVVESRLVGAAIHIRSEGDRPRTERLRDEVCRMTGLEPEIRVERKFPSDRRWLP